MQLRIGQSYSFRNSSGIVQEGNVDGAFNIPSGMSGGKKRQKVYIKFPDALRVLTRDAKSPDLVEDGTGFSYTLVKAPKAPRKAGSILNPDDFPAYAAHFSALKDHAKGMGALLEQHPGKKVELDAGNGFILRIFKKKDRAVSPRKATAGAKGKAKGKKK